MPVIGIDHIEIIVPDVKEYVTFMEKLGFEVVRWTDHHEGSAELKLPGENQTIFEIHQVLIEENPGINHISFRTRDIDELVEDLEKKDVKFFMGVHRSMTGRKNADIKDPIGLRIQLSDEQRNEIEDRRDVYDKR